MPQAPAFPTDQFWLVWTPGGDNPKHRHSSEHEALEEAQRLARVTNQVFYVAHVTHRCNVTAPPVETYVLHELPF